ncbi:MAG: apolipoprotein N-acyltransferase [Candidatus Omnitrophica bacterium]|nr:apolipoprotein N-acyltransferase [Candidatus Omnitrophota bacterium]
MREYQKSVLLCLLSAILLILSFPKPNLGFLAWFALVPWLFALRGQRPLRAFFLSYLVGLVFFSGIVYWVNYVSSLGFTVLVLYLALYFAVFGLVFSTVNCQLSTVNCFLIPCIWVSLEYIRSHLFTGFSWALLGYSQYRILPVIQISDITGAYGVSFLLVLVNVAIWRILSPSLRAKRSNPFLRLLRRQKSNHRASRNDSASPIYWALCPLLFVILALTYGYFKLSQPARGQSIKVAVVQGNIPQRMKWDPDARDFILEKYSRLTETAALNRPDIIIWPETSVPGYLEDEPELLKEISSLSGRVSPAYLLVGTPQQGRNRTLYNSATLLFQGKSIKRYDKLHLVPFGEFIPWPVLFSRFSFAGLVGNFSRGEDYTVFSLSQTKPKIKFSALICFEDVFGYLARRFVQKGAQILVNMTNDAWFEDSSEPEQHLQASVLRAVENRVNVVRSANTGVSCFIDPQGKILSRVTDSAGRDVLVEGEKTQELKIVSAPGFYTAFGDIFAWLCLILTGAFLVYGEGWLGCQLLERSSTKTHLEVSSAVIERAPKAHPRQDPEP